MARTMTHPTPVARRRGRRSGGVVALVALVALGVVLIAAVVVLFTVVLNRDSSTVSVAGPSRQTMLQAGDEVPTFAGPGLTGGRVDWQQFAGAPTVLAVWAPWCPHCQVEMPVLGQVAKDYPGVQVVTVETAVGQRTGPSGEGFFAQNRLFFPTVKDDGTTIMEALGVSSFPTLYFVGSDGRVVDSVVGELPKDQLAERFRQLSSLER